MRAAIFLALSACVGVAPGLQQAEIAAPDGNVLTAYLDRADIHPPVAVGPLTIFPISLSRTHRLEGVLSMDEALKNGALVIEELDPPDIQRARFTNNSPRQLIFLMSGEVVTGGRQNRTLRSDALLGPASATVLPLYCVEKGRWQGKTGFAAAATVAPQEVRARAAQEAGQDAVWAEVARANRRLGASGKDEDLAAAMESPENARRLGALRKRILPGLPANSAGVVLAWGPNIVSADLFNSSELFAKLRGKVLDSCLSQYRPEELDSPAGRRIRRPPRPTQKQVQLYLQACYRARFSPGPMRGAGRVYHVRGARYGETLTYRPGRQGRAGAPRAGRQYMVHTALMQQIVPVRPVPLPRRRLPGGPERPPSRRPSADQ